MSEAPPPPAPTADMLEARRCTQLAFKATLLKGMADATLRGTTLAGIALALCRTQSWVAARLIGAQPLSIDDVADLSLAIGMEVQMRASQQD